LKHELAQGAENATITRATKGKGFHLALLVSNADWLDA
jgi:hypothetical protein